MSIKNYTESPVEANSIVDFDTLLQAIKDDFTQLLRVNLNIGPFLMKERLLRIERREELREALRTCGSGNEASKIFVKSYITTLLADKYKISEENIHLFLNEDSEYRFKVNLEKYIGRYGKFGLEKLIERYFSEIIIKSEKRIIDEKALNRAFGRFNHENITFPEKMDILCQKIYENYRER